jgi:hypothetical protein
VRLWHKAVAELSSMIEVAESARTGRWGGLLTVQGLSVEEGIGQTVAKSEGLAAREWAGRVPFWSKITYRVAVERKGWPREPLRVDLLRFASLPLPAADVT